MKILGFTFVRAYIRKNGKVVGPKIKQPKWIKLLSR